MTSSDPANRRRSKRVMLQVPVVLLAETPERKQAQEQTQTLVVNAHGGLMKLKMELLAGQPFILMNAKSGMKQGCRVVRIEQPSLFCRGLRIRPAFPEILAHRFSARRLETAPFLKQSLSAPALRFSR